MTHHPSVAGWVTPGRPDAGKSPDLATVAPSASAAMPPCHSVPFATGPGRERRRPLAAPGKRMRRGGGGGAHRAAGEHSRASGLRPGPTSALCGKVPHMQETRTEKISVNLTPSVLARLDDMRARRRWTRSTAAAVLIEHGLDSEDRMTALAGQATTSQEYTALTQENLGVDGKGR